MYVSNAVKKALGIAEKEDIFLHCVTVGTITTLHHDHCICTLFPSKVPNVFIQSQNTGRIQCDMLAGCLAHIAENMCIIFVVFIKYTKNLSWFQCQMCQICMWDIAETQVNM